jgi:hypothetical protein
MGLSWSRTSRSRPGTSPGKALRQDVPVNVLRLGVSVVLPSVRGESCESSSKLRI